MIAALLLALGTAARDTVPPDAVYSSAALRAFVAAAAAGNRTAPLALRGYTAEIESEVAFVLRDTLGREHVTQVEQIASGARWHAGGAYELHVRGYRSRSVGAPFSALTMMRSWTVPILYGERLDIGLQSAGGPSARRAASDPLRAVHPLATDRDSVYRFTGGDTVATIRTGTETTPIVRIHVEPRVPPGARVAVFYGDLDFDAARNALVRMRGRLLVTGRPPGRRPIITRMPGLTAAAFVELVNARFQDGYWLPTYQRTELQAGMAVMGDDRSIFRLVSHFDAHHLLLGPGDSATADSATADSTRRRTVTFARDDSMSRYAGWRTELGATAPELRGSDFDDVTPRVWQPAPPPRRRLLPRRLDEVFRYNRIEGLYLGASWRAAVPRVTEGAGLHAYGGWATAEGTPRGTATLSVRRGGWSVAATAERSLAGTNDFERPVGDSPGNIGALLWGVDDRDYVDRVGAHLTLVQVLGDVDRGLLTLQVGTARDDTVSAHVTRGLFSAGTAGRPNRAATPGRYARVLASLELNPSVSGIFLRSGVGARLTTEAGWGELQWLRTEATLTARGSRGSLAGAARLSGAVLVADEPPLQKMLELGGGASLPGFDYKRFAGDRAAVGRVFGSWTSSVLRAPKRVGNWFVPGLSPGVTLGMRAAWAEASTQPMRDAVAALTPWAPGLSGPTQRVRSSADASVTFFGGTVSVGTARAVGETGPWRFVFSVGQPF